MKRNKIALLITILFILTIGFASCASSMDEGAFAPEMASDDSYSESVGTTLSKNSGIDIDTTDAMISEKIIYNAYMTLTTDMPEDIGDTLTDKAISLGGYIGSSNMYKESGYVRINLQVRIPSDQLSGYMDYAKTIAKVDASDMDSQNITEQYYDITKRLEHEQLQAAQLEELMETADTIDEILKVRDYLSQVQETIEVYEGKLRLWNSQVDYSTIEFRIVQEQSITITSDGPKLITLGETGQSMVSTFKKSAIYVANFFSFLLRALAALIIPLLILTPIVILIVFLARRRRKIKQKKAKEAPPAIK